MSDFSVIGLSVPRKESWDKVTGNARYTNDFENVGLLHARMLTSPYAHARIISIDYGEASRASGVRAILTGRDFPDLVGSSVVDRPPIAIDKVRYNGEPVAVVVADSEAEAQS